MILRRISQLYCVTVGYFIKWKIDLFGISSIKALKQSDRTPQLIVSLTSYGRRVEKVVYYTIVSMFKQKLAPNKIILWLDEKEWDNESLPSKIKSLEKYGLEIKFYKNIRSYMKIIPTLKMYAEDVIVTVDDDVYYPSELLRRLYDAYKKESTIIQCAFCSNPQYDKAGKMLAYNLWKKETNGKFIFPLGVGGVLYPPHSLHSDVTNEELFMKYSPMADDLWLWLMALKQGTKHNVVSIRKINYYAFDNLYQYFHKGSALTHANSGKSMNDVQLGKLFEYYQINSEDDLNNISSKLGSAK